jgi:hypothetical protein
MDENYFDSFPARMTPQATRDPAFPVDCEVRSPEWLCAITAFLTMENYAVIVLDPDLDSPGFCNDDQFSCQAT